MKKSLLIAAVTAALLAGCATQRFNVGGEANNSPRHDDYQTFWISGIGQTQTLDAAKICGGAAKVRAVETQLAPLDIVLGMVTFGIYTPRTARVYCN